MAYFADLLMINEMTKPLKKGESPTVDPLLNYLKRRGHPSEDLRLFLIALLETGIKGRRLVLARMRRRPTSKEAVESHVGVFDRIQELVNKSITPALCADIVKHLPDYRYQRTTAKGKTTFHLHQRIDDGVARRVRRRREHPPEQGPFDWMHDVREDLKREGRKPVAESLQFVGGKKLSQRDAIRIAAIQFNKAEGTVRKAYKAIIKERRDQ